jgi:SAM-dependent methyltransferase
VGRRYGLPVDERVEVNRRIWDEMAVLHQSTYADAAFEGLLPFERSELGALTGRRVCHLQCHIGGDTMALAELGATEVVGVDFSPAAIGIAAERVAAAGLADRIRFVEATIEEAPAATGGGFEVVYTSWGVLCWLPDLAGWAATVASLLVDGGWLYLAETHPYALTRGVGATDLPYGGGQPTFSEEQGDYSYADATFASPASWEWSHGLGEIVTALTEAGFRLAWLHEHTVAPWHLNRADELYCRADRLWEVPDDRGLPLSFSLRAEKPLSTRH